MVGPIVFCIIVLSIIIAFLLAWLFYQKARDQERMYLLEKGEKLEEIIEIQKRNKFRFVFPWLKLGIVTLGVSVAFLLIALFLEDDPELFKGFLITFIIGTCLGISQLVNHFIDQR